MDTMMDTMAKEGTFDWILQYEELKEYFKPSYTGIQKDNAEINVLVVGCGTSKLSKLLVDNESYGQIVSIDNDAGCIEHMKLEYPDPELVWLVYDIVEDCGKVQHNCIDVDESFDLVVDKGTFDAILVEGSVASMVKDIVRLLAIGGVYIVCSIFSKDVLSKLLGAECLGLQIQVFEIKNTFINKNTSATVVICTKTANRTINLETFQALEYEILNEHYQDEHPLLTDEARSNIKAKFIDLSTNPNGTLSLAEAHRVIFVDNIISINTEMLSYDFDLFEEDLSNFPLTHAGYISATEAIAFLEQMQ